MNDVSGNEVSPEQPHNPPASEPIPNSPNWMDVPKREVKEYEWHYDEEGNPLFPLEWEQYEFNPDETAPRKRITKDKFKRKSIIVLLTVIFLLAC